MKEQFSGDPLPEECQGLFKKNIAILSLSLQEFIQASSSKLESIQFENPSDDWPIIKRGVFNKREFEILTGKNVLFPGKCALINGYRGVGKTTAAKKLFPDATFIEFSEQLL